ncbi:MAG TPA: hypothetical protein VLT92_05825 [Burkholderiales bacterium]|nr:hypothetical protein [Burkholderiales bacterium]
MRRTPAPGVPARRAGQSLLVQDNKFSHLTLLPQIVLIYAYACEKKRAGEDK